MSIAVSLLAFNADLRIQVALILTGESLFRFFVFKSGNKEKILSESAFELGSDLTAFKRDFKFGY